MLNGSITGNSLSGVTIIQVVLLNPGSGGKRCGIGAVLKIEPVRTIDGPYTPGLSFIAYGKFTDWSPGVVRYLNPIAWSYASA